MSSKKRQKNKKQALQTGFYNTPPLTPQKRHYFSKNQNFPKKSAKDGLRHIAIEQKPVKMIYRCDCLRGKI